MYKIAEIAVSKTTYDFDLPFTYFIPSFMENNIKQGMRVMVPFGKGNAKRQGLVLSLSNSDDINGLKPISYAIDTEPIINNEGIEIIKFLKETTFCTYFNAVKLLLPAGLSVQSEKFCSINKEKLTEDLSERQNEIINYVISKKSKVKLSKLCKDLMLSLGDIDLSKLISDKIIIISEEICQKINDKTMAMVKIADKYVNDDLRLVKMGEKQKKVIDILYEFGLASIKEICYYGAVSRSSIDTLCKKGFVEYIEKEVFRIPKNIQDTEIEQSLSLTDAQTKVYKEIKSDIEQKNVSTGLLYGVTGSGKTQIFLKLIHDCLDNGKTSIMLVPEISLTAQTVDTFCKEFGSKVALIHSGLSLGERMDEWKRIKEKEATVVVGTRSAIFAPCENLGLIIIDEEQESTYKSDSSPRFHAREVAKLRARYHNSYVLLASATPSIESYYYASGGKYKLYELRERYMGQSLPDVYIEDTSKSYNNERIYSQKMIDELAYNLKHNEQSIILLNRRGYNTVVMCSECSSVASCPNCSVALTYHSANNQLICHQCGYKTDLLKSCEKCGSTYIAYKGTGTQMAQEKLQSIFPSARILRMDMDTTMSKYSYEKNFGAFLNEEYDIMIGTQMVAKGHNFPNVTLVGVLGADKSLYSEDFRACEKTFSLITQVVGRSGRSEKKGRAIIETASPLNDVIIDASNQDYDNFYNQEIQTRRLCLYPPFCDVCLIGFTSENEQHVKKGAYTFADIFVALAKTPKYCKLPIRFLGPCKPQIFKLNNKFRYKITLKCKNIRLTRELISTAIIKFNKIKGLKDVNCFADMYYDSNF